MQEGIRREFEQWWMRFGPPLQAAAKQHAWGEDVLQDTLADLICRLEQGKIRLADIRPSYVMKMFRWRHIDRIRRERYEPLEHVPKDRNSGLSVQEDAVTVVFTEELLNRLTERQREVLMRRWAGYSYAEIAKDLRIKENSAASLYRFAKLRLIDLMQGTDL